MLSRHSNRGILQPRPFHQNPALIDISELFEDGSGDVQISFLASDTYCAVSMPAVPQSLTMNIHRSTILTSTLLPFLLTRIFNPQSGFSFGLDPRDAAS